MNPETEKKYQRLRSLFFGLGIVAAGMLFLSSVSNMVKSTAAKDWPVHSGVVTEEIRSGFSYYGGNWLQYTYEVEGKKYRGGRIGFGISRPLTQLKDGQIIQVYVNPVDNNDAVIAVGIVRGHFIGLVFSAGFVWVAFVIWRRTK